MENKLNPITIMLIVVAIACFILSFILVFMSDDEVRQNSTSICYNQCSYYNMTFYKYNYGGYQNPACLCKDNGLIKTIYTE
jgi:hypothetical protein